MCLQMFSVPSLLSISQLSLPRDLFFPLFSSPISILVHIYYKASLVWPEIDQIHIWPLEQDSSWDLGFSTLLLSGNEFEDEFSKKQMEDVIITAEIIKIEWKD